MVRSLTFVPMMLCAAAIVSAQAQAPAPESPAPTPAPAVQQPAPQPVQKLPEVQPPAPPVANQSRALASTVTYSGCLKPGTAPGAWLLDSAAIVRPGGASASASAPAGASPVGTSGVAKSSFTLSTKPGTELKPHANHKVEIVGIVTPAKAGAAPGATQELAVESFKMISATCP